MLSFCLNIEQFSLETNIFTKNYGATTVVIVADGEVIVADGVVTVADGIVVDDDGDETEALGEVTVAVGDWHIGEEQLLIVPLELYFTIKTSVATP